MHSELDALGEVPAVIVVGDDDSTRRSLSRGNFFPGEG